MEKHEIRTAAGNRIDRRMALGISRSVLNSMAHNYRKRAGHGAVNFSIQSLRGRQKAMAMIKEDCGPLFAGMVTKKDFRTALLAVHDPIRTGTGNHFDALAIHVSGVDLRDPGRGGRMHCENWPYSSWNITAIIEIHLMARMAQRLGYSTAEEFLGIGRKIAAWANVGVASGEAGAWMMPVETGLVCGFMVDIPARYGEGTDRVGLMKTFIDIASMKETAHGAWRRMIDAGALEITPRFPTWEAPTADQMALWSIMREEGTAWELRRDHALRIRGEERRDAAAHLQRNSPLEDEDPEMA